MIKPAIERLAAALTLVVLSPLLLAVALGVGIGVGRPILFKQTRTGFRSAPFDLYKFRTMTDERNSDGDLLPDEERLTPFGQFLRRYSLDEMPQLVNVLRGVVRGSSTAAA